MAEAKHTNESLCVGKITDVTTLKEMLDRTSDFLERIELEDRLHQLGGDAGDPTYDFHASSASGTGGQQHGKISPNPLAMSSSFHGHSAMDSLLKAPAPRVKSPLPQDAGSGSVGGVPLVRSATQVKEQILLWARRCSKQHCLPVENMTGSFSDGLVFCAILHFYFPHSIDFQLCSEMSRKERLNFAFAKAEELANVPQLLDADDIIMFGKKLDFKIMFTYLTEMYRRMKNCEGSPKTQPNQP